MKINKVTTEKQVATFTVKTKKHGVVVNIKKRNPVVVINGKKQEIKLDVLFPEINYQKTKLKLSQVDSCNADSEISAEVTSSLFSDEEKTVTCGIFASIGKNGTVYPVEVLIKMAGSIKVPYAIKIGDAISPITKNSLKDAYMHYVYRTVYDMHTKKYSAYVEHNEKWYMDRACDIVTPYDCNIDPFAADFGNGDAEFAEVVASRILGISLAEIRNFKERSSSTGWANQLFNEGFNNPFYNPMG